jgi:hypothetical protein
VAVPHLSRGLLPSRDLPGALVYWVPCHCSGCSQGLRTIFCNYKEYKKARSRGDLDNSPWLLTSLSPLYFGQRYRDVNKRAQHLGMEPWKFTAAVCQIYKVSILTGLSFRPTFFSFLFLLVFLNAYGRQSNRLFFHLQFQKPNVPVDRFRHDDCRSIEVDNFIPCTTPLLSGDRALASRVPLSGCAATRPSFTGYRHDHCATNRGRFSFFQSSWWTKSFPWATGFGFHALCEVIVSDRSIL